MNDVTRRGFLHSALAISAAAAVSPLVLYGAPESGQRKMTICLSGGAIGVSADQSESIRLAHIYGFESVEPNGEYLTSLVPDQLQQLLGAMKTNQLVFGAAGLPMEFRQDDLKFASGLERLPKIAAGLERAGVSRVGTWLSPCDNSRTYLQNFRLHTRRLKEIALVLKDHGQRLGLEYVGTKTAREHCRYPFIHSMAEMKDLIAEIDAGNVGFVLDSWHWWQADDTATDLLTLNSSDIVSVDLNDAPAGVPKDKQLDGRRELPMATGIIDTGAFLNALNQIGYDGPIRAEPFNKPLNDLDNEPACEATAAAMKKAFALIH